MGTCVEGTDGIHYDNEKKSLYKLYEEYLETDKSSNNASGRTLRNISSDPGKSNECLSKNIL